jgi:hypothetical protein
MFTVLCSVAYYVDIPEKTAHLLPATLRSASGNSRVCRAPRDSRRDLHQQVFRLDVLAWNHQKLHDPP